MINSLPALAPELRLMTGDRLLLIGPPGTGKTTAIMGMCVDLLAQGWIPADIAIVSFTRAAVKEVRDRLANVTGERHWEGVGTLHSRAARLQGECRFLKDEDWRDFAQLTRYQLTPENDANKDSEVEARTGTEDDKLRMVHCYARNRMISLEQAASDSGSKVMLDRLRCYVRLFEQYKADVEKIDFVDVIALAVKDAVSITQPVIIVDESQDLSPLQIAFLLPAIEQASIVVIAGDDDQAIFEFQGASPAWIRSLHTAPGWRTHILPQSWRCPAAVQRLAERIIASASNRVPKTYLPRPEEGEHVQMPLVAALQRYCTAPEDGVFVLCRGKKQCSIVISLLFHAGVPYRAERGSGPRPYESAALLSALGVFYSIRAGDAVSALLLSAAIDRFCGTRTKTETSGLIPHGVKAKFERWSRTHSMATIDDLAAQGLGDLVAQCDDAPLGCFQRNAQPEVIVYLGRLVDDQGHLPEPQITVTTWHGSKGREAHTVIVWAEIPRPCLDALQIRRHADAEIRAAYVAVTRAKYRVVICWANPGQPAYPFPRL